MSATLGKRGALGAIGGVAGGLAMEAVREPLIRTGSIEFTPPRRIVGRLERITRRQPRERPVVRLALHLAYSAALGAMLAADNRLGRTRGENVTRDVAVDGVAFGAAVYAANILGVLPALHLVPAPSKQSRRVQARELGIHLLFGSVSAATMHLLAARRSGANPAIRANA